MPCGVGGVSDNERKIGSPGYNQCRVGWVVSVKMSVKLGVLDMSSAVRGGKDEHRAILTDYEQYCVGWEEGACGHLEGEKCVHKGTACICGLLCLLRLCVSAVRVAKNAKIYWSGCL